MLRIFRLECHDGDEFDDDDGIAIFGADLPLFGEMNPIGNLLDKSLQHNNIFDTQKEITFNKRMVLRMNGVEEKRSHPKIASGTPAESSESSMAGTTEES
jgi:hypothetical protein